LFCAACLLSGLAFALLSRLVDTQSIRYALAALGQGSLWLTALFLALLTAAVGFLAHSLFVGGAAVGLVSVLLTLANYYKSVITSTPLSLGDLSLIRQLGSIAALNTASLTVSRNTALALVGLVLWLAVLLLCSRPLRIRWRRSLIGAAGAALAFVLVFWVFLNSLVCTPLEAGASLLLSQAAANEAVGGPVLGLWRSAYILAHRDLGADYSQEYMERLVSSLVPDDSVPADREAPNIILILSESFFDPTDLDAVTYYEDPVAEFHALQAEGVSGKFYTRSLGYGTCNIELEVLTGMNTGLLSGEDLYSWDPEVFSRLPSVVSLLGDAGYSTTMLHTFNDSIYHRTDFFSQLGFDRMYFSDGFAQFYSPAMAAADYWAYMETRIAGSFYSDDLLADGLIALYEQGAAQSDAPQFLYGISMENHSPYNEEKYSSEELTVDPQSDLTGEAAEMLLNLSQGLSDASAALGKLVDYFRTCDEPTVIVFYGDHRAGLGLDEGGTVYSALGMVPDDRDEWSLDDLTELYSTEYLIWSNDPDYLPGEPGSAADTSCNYLGVTILDMAGVQRPLYWQLITQLSQTRLCDTAEYHLGRDGVLSDQLPASGSQRQQLDALTYLLNDALYGEQYVTDKIG
jgi:phosphoglycerol transferase MdoB-like AlkP superfamily enzyme